MIAARLKDGNYYRNKEMLYRDLMLMVDNCKLFNQEDSEYHLTAIKLQNEICELFPDVCAYMLHNDKAIEEAHSKSKSVE